MSAKERESLPDAAPSSPAKLDSQDKLDAAPDLAISADNLASKGVMDAKGIAVRNPPADTKRKTISSSSTRPGNRLPKKPRVTTAATQNSIPEGDRKLPAREDTVVTTRRSSYGGGKTATSDHTDERTTGYGGTTNQDAVPPVVAAAPSRAPPPPTPAKRVMKHLLIGRGSDVWNARLHEVRLRKQQASAAERLPRVTAMELLQQAQERCVLPPTRFPPRESPLHAIFQSSTTAKDQQQQRTNDGDRQIFACLETCYRDMLHQDVQVEETLREEYKKLNKGAMQQRVGEIFAQEAHLKKKEQAVLTKLRGWVSSSSRSG